MSPRRRPATAVAILATCPANAQIIRKVVRVAPEGTAVVVTEVALVEARPENATNVVNPGTLLVTVLPTMLGVMETLLEVGMEVEVEVVVGMQVAVAPAVAVRATPVADLDIWREIVPRVRSVTTVSHHVTTLLPIDQAELTPYRR